MVARMDSTGQLSYTDFPSLRSTRLSLLKKRKINKIKLSELLFLQLLEIVHIAKFNQIHSGWLIS